MILPPELFIERVTVVFNFKDQFIKFISKHHKISIIDEVKSLIPFSCPVFKLRNDLTSRILHICTVSIFNVFYYYFLPYYGVETSKSTRLSSIEEKFYGEDAIKCHLKKYEAGKKHFFMNHVFQTGKCYCNILDFLVSTAQNGYGSS